MKVKALVRCIFEIEYEDENEDIEATKENITLSGVEELISLETDNSIQYVYVLDILKQE